MRGRARTRENLAGEICRLECADLCRRGLEALRRGADECCMRFKRGRIARYTSRACRGRHHAQTISAPATLRDTPVTLLRRATRIPGR